MISFPIRVQCSYGADASCENHVVAMLTLRPYVDDDEDVQFKVESVSIDPEFGWYDKSGIRHLFCREHAKAVKL